MNRLQSVCPLLVRSSYLLAGKGAQQYAGPLVATLLTPTAAALSLQKLQSCHCLHGVTPGTGWQIQQRSCYSSQPGNTSNDEAVVDQLNRMMEVMMQNPAMQQMLLSRLPPHMQKPEVLRAMMANPEVRARIAGIAQQSGLAQMFTGIDPAKMAAGLAASSQAGLDAAKVMDRFYASPTLATRMSNPRVLAALMDMASHGPDALKKYSGDKDVVEAAMEAGDIIEQLQKEQQGGSSDSSSSGSSSSGSMTAVESQLGMNPQDLMQKLMQRPDLLAKFQDPKVQQALQEVSQSPWKIVKYMFNKDVMSAIKEMKNMLQPQAPKQ